MASQPKRPEFTSNPRIPFQMSTERPPLAPPDGKPLIVHILVAVENWRFDDHMPRQIMPGPHGARTIPDVVNWSWAEYGMRCGMPRLLRALGERNIKADACINAGVLDAYPSVAEAILEAGWEFQGHGLHQRALAEDDEAAQIKGALDKLEAFCGYRPRGWTGPGLKETMTTLDHLREAGVVYTCDWVVDDLPCWIRTKHGPMVAVPYTLELNDSVVYAVEKHSSSEQYDRLRHTIDGIEAELEHSPRVVSLSLHHHLNGVPHRIKFVEKMLDLLLQRKDTVFMTGGQIADWFIAADKANDGKVNQGKFME
jgi:peptidoglycan/xylan/chitin deacetylase (PgdA/CDA1 family)